jgi:4a-hydroxytetrahydrobiopterin dehydratase
MVPTGAKMHELAQMNCTPVKNATPKLDNQEILQLLNEIPGWLSNKKEGELRLEKTFKFPDFEQALAFTNLVAHEAALEDHHPAILTEWGKVTVTWWTHVIKGLHQNDFIMSARTDQLYDEIQNSKKQHP